MAQRKYDQKLIEEVIAAVVNHGRSVAQAARDFNIVENTLYAKVWSVNPFSYKESVNPS